MRTDVHTHFVPPLPDFGKRYGDSRWPAFHAEGAAGRLVRDGAVVRAVSAASWDAAARIEEMDRSGVDRHVLSPLPPIICDWADPDAGAQWCAQVNDGIAATVATFPDRFSGLGTVPLQHPDAAVATLERAHGSGLAGVEIGTTGGGRELDHPDVREFFAAAAELGMLVFVHPLILGSDAGWTDRITGFPATFGLGMTTDTAVAASKLVFGGVVQECPELRICLAHGGGTFAWALPRIARAWDSQADRPARELVRNVFVDSVVYSSANVRYLCDTIGADHVLFGTDFPLPAQDDLTGATLADLDPDERRLVEHANVAGLLTADSAAVGAS